MAKRRLHQRRHPINAFPFEAFYDGSWWNVECMRIKDGITTTCFEHRGLGIEDQISVANLRIRSRKANLSDCTFFLRPGVEICVRSTNPSKSESCRGSPHPAWADAKITSIQRNPHELHCNCRFYVSFGGVRRPHSSGSKEVQEMKLNDIAILQQFDRKPCEDECYRWSYSKDCLSVYEAKFRGQILADISWLLVASSLKGVRFEVRSMQNKMVYRVVDGDQDIFCLGSDKSVKAINFQGGENGVIIPIVRTFIPEGSIVTVLEVDKIETGSCVEDELYSPSPYNLMSLRRSTRRNVQPDRFFGDGCFQAETGRRKRQKEEAPSVNLFETGSNSLNRTLECRTELEKVVHASKNHANGMIIVAPSKTKLREVKTVVIPKRQKEGRTTITVPMSKIELRKVNTVLIPKNQEEKSTTTVPLSKTELKEVKTVRTPESQKSGTTTTTKEKIVDNEGVCGEVQHFKVYSKQKKKRVTSAKAKDNSVTTVPTTTDIVLYQKDRPHEELVANNNKQTDIVLFQKDHPHDKFAANSNEKFCSASLKCVRNGSTARQRNNVSGKRRHGELEMRLKEADSCKEVGKKRLLSSTKKRCYEGKTHKRNTPSNSEYKEIIERCMENIQNEIQKPQPTALSRWESMHSNQRKTLSLIPPTNDHGEADELEDLWKEMEATMSSFHLVENNAVGYFKEVEELSCQHEFRLDEEIGLICQFCKYVHTEIRYILPPFLQSSGRIRGRERYFSDQCKHDEPKHSDDTRLDILRKPSSSKDISKEEEHESVWTLIPDLRSKLLLHQKKAFEFLWRNIAGSLMPADMQTSSERTGGCVIAHAPGAGKTFLMAAFMTSYLKLFPTKRILIISPKTIQYTWFKEFKKWEVPIPVYQILARSNYKSENQNLGESPNKLNRDVMHAVDCLEKLQKWHEGPSVLLMSYPSFLSLMRENSKFEHWNYMARVLKQSTGLLILDEGHNPRSTKSMLRKLLMKVQTDQRILLSGTLFQNNFEEYFNSLCLARPRFIAEVLTKLAPNKIRKLGQKRVTRRFKEKLARRVFLDKIAQRINSKVEQVRRQGLNMLKKLTNDFMDVYEGGGSDILPGLQTYKLLLKPTMIQQAFLAKLQKVNAEKRYPIELELLVTFVSIHPWLVRTLAYADKYYSPDELEEIEKGKLDVKQGSKVRFVVNLVCRCIIKREKVLIFCRNIAPIKLFVEIFENIFGWSKGDEVLVLQGEQELFERAKVIDKFEEPSGLSQVLLASIAACGEGISLTAASRVVLLDSEWNYSKTKQAVARAFRPGQERVVYVYQLLAFGTLEVEKYGKNNWKEKVSRMISAEAGMEDLSCTQAEDIDDEVLREIVEEDQGESFHMITKDEKLSNGSAGGKKGALFSF